MTSMTESEGAVIRSDRRGRMLVGAEQREAMLDESERSGMSGIGLIRQRGGVCRLPPERPNGSLRRDARSDAGQKLSQCSV